jgi:N-acetylmuramoyl-L-alanine amidase
MKMRSLLLLLLLLWSGYATVAQTSVPKKIIVCIDPGHGGKDPGKLASSKLNKHEKDINLAVALKLGGYLEERIPGVKVIYTRETDEFVSLEDRVNFANNSGAHYFMSIHCNSHQSKWMSGTQTHIHSHNFKASRALALRIEKEFAAKVGRKSNGIRSASDRGQNLYVLQYTEMPSVLVELGYISNAQEEKYLNWEKGQDFLASGIYRAFKDYLAQKTKDSDGPKDTIYKVQLAASVKPITFKTEKFEELGLQVVEHVSSGNFKYKYMVGREYDSLGAQKLLKSVKAAGFPDAFIVSMNAKEAKVFRKLQEVGEEPGK